MNDETLKLANDLSYLISHTEKMLIAIEWVKEDPERRAFSCAGHFLEESGYGERAQNYAFTLPMPVVVALEYNTRTSLEALKAQYEAL